MKGEFMRGAEQEASTGTSAAACIYVMNIIIDKIKLTFVAQTLLEAEPQPNQQIKNCCSIFEP
jgi:hypothetical protein